MAVSKRTRFEVFKRDGFRCLYCGASPLTNTLTVKLQADHVEAKSRGGPDDAANLVTACIDCNLGKSDVPLDEKRLRSGFASEEEREHAEQIREYLAVQREIASAKRDAEALVLEHWEDRMGPFPWQLPRFIPGAIKDFGVEAVLEFVDIVAQKGISSATSQVKYFCGILRRRRKPDQQSPPPSSSNKPITADELRDAEWKIVTMMVRAYWKYRVFMPLTKDPTELLKRAIGSTKERRAPLPHETIFQIIDDVAWIPTEYEDGIYERRFFSMLEEATAAGAFDPKADMMFEDQNEHARSHVDQLWHALVGSDIAADPLTTAGLVSIIRDYGIGAIVSAMLQITEWKVPPLEREKALREELARAFAEYGASMMNKTSPVWQWPEWQKANE